MGAQTQQLKSMTQILQEREAQIAALQQELAFNRQLTDFQVPEELIKQVANSTGAVKLFTSAVENASIATSQGKGTGSYVIFQETDDAFYVLSNEHVVVDEEKEPGEHEFIYLEPSKLGKDVTGISIPWFKAEVLFKQRNSSGLDLSLLKLPKSEVTAKSIHHVNWLDILKPVQFSEDLRAGQFVFQMGAGKGRSDTVSAGMITTQTQTVPMNHTMTTGLIMNPSRSGGQLQWGQTVASYGEQIPDTKGIVHTALTEPGNSGSGLYNAQGHCMGITRAVKVEDSHDPDDPDDNELNPFYGFAVRTFRIANFLVRAAEDLEIPPETFYLTGPDGNPIVPTLLQPRGG